MLNFKMSELIYSETAIKNNINNMPDINSMDNMLNLIYYCLQPVRELLGAPMIITSGYRNPLVNRLVGGQAVDFTVLGITPNQIISIIKTSKIEFDQLINEYDKWVHISYNKGKNRKRVLKY